MRWLLEPYLTMLSDWESGATASMRGSDFTHSLRSSMVTIFRPLPQT